MRIKCSFGLMLLCTMTTVAMGQSLLDGTTFEASTYNLPDSVGVVRLTDTTDSNCRSADASPVGEDIAPDGECLTVDSGGTPVTMTFNAGPQTIGGLAVTPTVVPFAGIDPENPILISNEATEEFDVPLPTWSNSGDLMEFTMRTTDNSFPGEDESDYFGFAANGIQYPNAKADSEVSFVLDEELGNNTNFYLWFENEDGPFTDYEIFLPTGIGAGRHPVDESREVIYILFSQNQIDEVTDSLAGGSLDYYSHGSTLAPDPSLGNLLNLADGVGIDGLEITGWGLGVLMQPPETEDIVPPGLLGDFDGDFAFTAADIDLLSANVGQGDLFYDLTGDGLVDNDDRLFWISDVAGSLLGDADLSGAVQFPDFLALSANFGKAGGWAAGDFDGSGDIQFPDFLSLSANFGQPAGAGVAVPEPSCLSLLWFALLPMGLLRKRA